MNLIDRDALPKGRVEWEDIAEAPTVDAIPVSWILDQWLNNYYDMPESAKIVIRTMIKNWREENANHD